MNMYFGGAQGKLRDSLVEDVDGYFGRFPRVLKKGDTQKMWFEPGHEGPFYMPPAEREKRRLDTEYGPVTTKDKSKIDLMNDLTACGVSLPSKPINKINKDWLQKKAREKGIALEKRTRKVKPGWQGKPKGLLQVLWERGFINEEELEQYKLESTDEDGQMIEEYSLRHLMSNCTDFDTEKSQLQTIAEKYDMEVIMTPKYHCEIAGCGIEYSWGAAKAKYRSISLERKRTKKGFFQSVKDSLQVLNKTTVRKCDRKSRTYIMAYYSIEVLKVNEEGQSQNSPDVAISMQRIEKFRKLFKSHRCALDFDQKFCKSLILKTD